MKVQSDDSGSPGNVRPSPIAGRWYEGNPSKLARQIDAYINDSASPPINGEVIALIVPHAGHRYSGKTAGFAFRCIQGSEADLVAIVSPMHGYHPAPFLTSGHDAYSTPLGTIPVQTSAVQEVDEYLQKHLHNGLTPILNDSEHSLEILLPFLQRALSNPFLLLPIMVRDNTPQHDKVLGQGLAQILKTRKGILIASTDLSHFYSEKEARVLDQEMLRQIQNLSPEGVLAAEQAGSGFACGAPAVAAVLWAAQELGANQVKVLHYSTSAEETGDKESVVGYGAAVVLKST